MRVMAKAKGLEKTADRCERHVDSVHYGEPSYLIRHCEEASAYSQEFHIKIDLLQERGYVLGDPSLSPSYFSPQFLAQS